MLFTDVQFSLLFGITNIFREQEQTFHRNWIASNIGYIFFVLGPHVVSLRGYS